MKDFIASKIRRIKIEYLLLLLLSMDFLRGSKILVLIFLAYSIFGIVIKDRRLIIDKELIFLALFCLSYFFIYSFVKKEVLVNFIYYLAGPLGFYLGGRRFIKDSSGNKELIRIILIIAFGYFIHGALNMYVSVSGNHFVDSTEEVLDFWSNSYILRTLEGVYFTIISSLLFTAVVVEGKELRTGHRVLIILATIFSLWTTISLGNRTLLVIAFITSLLSALLYISLSKRKLCSIMKIGVILLTAIALIVFDIGGIRTYIFHSQLFSRLHNDGNAIFASPRWEYYKRFFNTFYLYPFGIGAAGYDTVNFPFMHNVWLDIYVQTGIIPFIFFMLYTFSILGSLWRVLRVEPNEITWLVPGTDWFIATEEFTENTHGLIAVKITVFAVFIGIFTNFMVEPLLEANIYYIFTFCFLAGTINSFSKPMIKR